MANEKQAAHAGQHRCSRHGENRKKGVYLQGHAVTAFALPALDGRTVRLEDRKGKALLLFFWATW